MTDPTSLPNFPPPPQERPLTGRVLDALVDLQMQPNLDKEGDVAFVVQDQKLFVKVVAGEAFDIMRVFGQWVIADSMPQDLQTRLNGCNDITLGVNLVKSGIANGNLVLAVEQIITRQENPKAKLQVGVGLLLQALRLWHNNVQAKSRVEAGLDPQLPEGTPEGTEVGPWLSVGPGRPAAEQPPQDGQAAHDGQAPQDGQTAQTQGEGLEDPGEGEPR